MREAAEIVQSCKDSFPGIEKGKQHEITLKQLQQSMQSPITDAKQNELSKALGFPEPFDIMEKSALAKTCGDILKKEDRANEVEKNKDLIEKIVNSAKDKIAAATLEGKPYADIYTIHFDENNTVLTPVEEAIYQGVSALPGVSAELKLISQESKDSITYRYHIVANYHGERNTIPPPHRGHEK